MPNNPEQQSSSPLKGRANYLTGIALGMIGVGLIIGFLAVVSIANHPIDGERAGAIAAGRGYGP